MLWGPPGVGKSQMVAQVATRHQAPVIDIRLSQMEPSDLRGIPFRVGEHVDWAVPSMLPDAVRHGQEGILFLDEITSAPPSVSAAAYQLILDRRLGAYQVPEAGRSSRPATGRATAASPTACRRRSPTVFAFRGRGASRRLVAWAYANGMDERLIGFLRFRPELLFDFDPAHNPWRSVAALLGIRPSRAAQVRRPQ